MNTRASTPNSQNLIRSSRRNHGSRDVRAADVSRVLRMIRPSFRARGGDVELVAVADNQVTVRLSGAGRDRRIDFQETSGVIERIVRSRIPQIQEMTVV